MEIVYVRMAGRDRWHRAKSGSGMTLCALAIAATSTVAASVPDGHVNRTCMNCSAKARFAQVSNRKQVAMGLPPAEVYSGRDWKRLK